MQWYQPLNDLLNRPRGRRSASASALAKWWLTCNDELRRRLAHHICLEIAIVLWAIADLRDGPVMASRGRGRRKAIAKEGFRLIGGRRPREYRKSILAQANAIEDIAKLSSSIGHLAQIASGGKGSYSSLVKHAETLRTEANSYLESALRLRAEARLIGSRGPIISDESTLRGWLIKSLGQILKAASNHIRIGFIADLLNEMKFGAKNQKIRLERSAGY